MTSTTAGRGWTAVETAGLGLLFVIAVASFAGFGIFRAWPELLVTLPGAMAAYPVAFELLPRAQILAGFAVLILLISRAAGWRWVTAFVVVYLLSLSSELLGTTVGLPFGPYRYTEALGIKWFGHVPVLIPISWFTMALPSYALARSEGLAPSRLRRIVLAATILLAWDLALDPAMSAATAFWVWGSAGPYYGMPWLNLFGWFVTGFVLMLAMELLGAHRWVDRLPRRPLLLFYAANLALPIGLAAIAGMWGAIIACTAALAICWRLVRPRVALARAMA